MKAHHPCWNFVLVFLIFCWSCEIEDERGTIGFMVEELPESVYGKILGNNYPYLDRFIVNEDDQEIYFCNCPDPFNCTKNIISALNYVSGESKEIYRSTNLDTEIIFVRYSPSTHKLFFLDGTDRFLDGKNRSEYELIMLDVRSFEKEVIAGHIKNVSMNDKYFFYSDYDGPVYMKEISNGGTTKTLKVEGSVRHVASDTPEIIVYDYDSAEHKIYNYLLDSITFLKKTDDGDPVFFDWNGEIYYYYYYYYSYDYGYYYGSYSYEHRHNNAVVKQFKTGDIVFECSHPMTSFADFNPKCNKSAFVKTEQYSRLNYGFTYTNSHIIIKDMLTGDFTVPVSFYRHYNFKNYGDFNYDEISIGQVILLDNCNTIIYLIRGKHQSVTKFCVSSY